MALVMSVMNLMAAEPQGEQVIRIGTLPGKMKFDVEEFVVKPSARVRLILNNTDEMQHNLILCRPGKDTAMLVAQKAWTLGAEAINRQFVPEMPEVLHATKIVNPAQQDEIIFTAPTEAGDYPYVCTLPGHAFTMRGVMRVRTEPEAPRGVTLKDLVYLYYEGEWTNLPRFAELKPKRIKPVPSNQIDIGVVTTDFNFGLVFHGELTVPADGEYTFHLNSNDGSRLLLGEQLVVEFDGTHGATGFVQGRTLLTKGAHPLQLQYFQNTGAKDLMLVVTGNGIERTLFTKSDMAGDRMAHLHVGDKSLVVRSFVDGGPARSISVGLPGGVNYLFNAEKCFVEFGWTGMFLDNTPNVGKNENDRGGAWNKILGERFNVGAEGFPLRIGDSPAAPTVRFRGYRRTEPPQFLYEVDGITVRQTIAAVPGQTLKYDFEIGAAGQPIQFRVNPEGLTLSSTAGEFNGGVLTVPSSTQGRFSVTISQR